MNQPLEKRTLRQEIIKQRDALSAFERAQLSLAATYKLLAWPLYQQAKTVLLFAGVRSEIDTRFLTEQSLHLGKLVAMPRCVPKKRELLLLKIESWQELQPSYYGLLEPSYTAAAVSLSELDLVVVPGIVFSADGYRIGYGGGYYDRLLARRGDIPTIGLAFELQVVGSVPQDSHDIPVHFLVTEKGIRECRADQEERMKKGDTDERGSK